MDNPTLLAASLSLLDRQILDANDVPVGKVDDIEFAATDDGHPVASALLLGPLVLGPRLGGRLGVWVTAIGRRLRPEWDPKPVRIPVDGIRELGDTVNLRVPVGDTDALRVESWLRTKVIERLPGAQHAAQ